MKKITLLLFIGLLACKQTTPQNAKENKTSEETMLITKDISEQEINSENMVEAISAKVKRYDAEPLYYLRIGKANCMIEILVNDMPVYQSYELSNLASPLEINHKILKSGNQTVTVRMYPVGDLIKEDYDYGETITQLGDASNVRIKVIRLDKQGAMGLRDEEEILDHQSPTKDADGEVFAGTGLPFYEYTFEFFATVPYDLSEDSWGNAADLRTVDQDVLEQKMLDYYKTFLKEYKKGNEDFIAQQYFQSFYVQAQAYYKSKEEIQEMWDEELETINDPTVKPQPVKDYELVFYAQGGIAFLRLKTKDDLYYRNNCAGYIETTEDGIQYEIFFGLYLYAPKKGFNKKDFRLIMA
ncbi:hypothetical protein Q4603_22080 [Zobellia galactanivorans]|uniref:hypothetical protein n=1 Tax=Zobellia galactanivorans (strain DSM 12802 / CCUG 47099 / CIP 106680 / NCIMB 13871 / Dsij) TaxID=63186 RepID=UPI0026E1FB2D|nr:hypothetical protein [Zobellia galactanivorans]MDO6811319.1 hypothetical protein [Zobellia galactanivorans]